MADKGIIKESEKVIERLLVNEMKKVGGLCVKHTAQYCKGFPDRICIFPHGDIKLVELKTTGMKPSPMQVHFHKQLKERNVIVEIIDTTDGVKKFIQKNLVD